MSLFKNLLGGGAKDQEAADRMQSILDAIQRESGRLESLIESARTSADHLDQLHEPISKAGSEIEAVSTRLGEVGGRLEAVAEIAARIESIDQRTEELARQQSQAESHAASVAEDSRRIREVFEELSQKVDLAGDLKGRLESFLEIDKPFQLLRDDADTLRGRIEGTGEHLSRLREQGDRLLDSQKVAVQKFEAVDRRRDELARDLTDKERRIVVVEQAVRGLDGVRGSIDEMRRELGTLKVLGDSLTQKTSSLEAQREAVDRALAQADSLERAMRQIDGGIRQQRDNERTLNAMLESATALKALHEQVIERSSEIARVQRQTEDHAVLIQHEFTAAQNEMKNAVERFDFESKGLESVSQRMADLRGALTDFESRFRGLTESSQTVSELSTQTQSLSTQVRGLVDEAGRIDEEMTKLHAMRRDLDQADATTRDLSSRVARIEEARPAVEAIFRELDRLSGSQAAVRDAFEQTEITHGEVTRVRESLYETRTWLSTAQQSVAELRDQVGATLDMRPALEVTQQQAARIEGYMTAIESRGPYVEDLHRRVTEVATLGSELEQRAAGLQERMDAAEQRFRELGTQAEEADRISKTVADVFKSVQDAERRTEATGRAVASFETRCTSVEDIAERTDVLREELNQRQKALEEASKHLKNASKLRQEAATAAEKLDELSRTLGESLATADKRAGAAEQIASKLEDRVSSLKLVDKRLGEFEQRLANWEVVDQKVSRTLEEISARQGTVQSLQTDLDRMSAIAESTITDVRTITSVHREIAESRTLLDEMQARLRAIHEASGSLEERERQMARAEERLARAQGFLVDVQSSLEALQGQKAIVDQAVEKAGSLKFMLKQADAMIEGLRDERKMTTDVRDAITIVRGGDGAEDEEAEANAA